MLLMLRRVCHLCHCARARTRWGQQDRQRVACLFTTPATVAVALVVKASSLRGAPPIQARLLGCGMTLHGRCYALATHFMAGA